MKIVSTKTLVSAAAAATAAVAVTGGLAMASGSAGAAGNAHPQGDHTASDAAVTVLKCDGERSVNLRTRIVSSPFTFVEGAANDQDQAVPGASLALNGPAAGADTLLVTFSGESQLTGGDANDWMGLEVQLDGVPIQPFTAGADKLAFTGEPSWNSNSSQFCVRVGPGSHRLQAYANLHDSSGSHTLNGWLDDYTFSVQRFD